MIQAIAMWVTTYRRGIEVSKITRAVTQFIKQNWTSPLDYQKTLGLETRTWFIGRLVIVHQRARRSDLIQVFEKRPSHDGFTRNIAEWKDHSYAYGGLLGIHDVSISPGVTLGYVHYQLGMK